MPYQIKVSSLLEHLDGTDIQKTDWTCDALAHDSIDRIRRFYALSVERAAHYNGHSTVILASPLREVWTFTPPIHEAREIAQWERVIKRLQKR